MKLKLPVRPLRTSTGGSIKTQLIATVSVGVIALALMPIIIKLSNFDLVILALIYAIAAMGTDYLVGVAGQATVGTAAIMAVSGYAVGLATGVQSWLWLSAIIGMAAAAAAGLLVGLPSLRIGGLYLAISTLALQSIVSSGGQLLEQDTGNLGGFPVKVGTVLPSVSLSSNTVWYVLMVIITVGVAVSLLLVKRSKFGRSCLAVRENESFARTFGIDVGRTKVAAFVVSSLPIGLAGVLLAYQNANVDFGTYSLTLTLILIGMITIGGKGSIVGAILGSAVFVAIQYEIAQLFTGVSIGAGGVATPFILASGVVGLLIYLTLRFMPRGLSGINWRQIVRHLMRLRGRQLDLELPVAGQGYRPSLEPGGLDSDV